MVTVAKPARASVADYLDFTGNTAAFNSATVVARVEGYLEEIHFADGAQVKKGDLLFTIQQAQYQAQLEQAKAQVQAEKTSLWHATTELARYTGLPVTPASNRFRVTQSMGDVVAWSGAVRRLAIETGKVAADLRLLSMGPFPSLAPRRPATGPEDGAPDDPQSALRVDTPLCGDDTARRESRSSAVAPRDGAVREQDGR